MARRPFAEQRERGPVAARLPAVSDEHEPVDRRALDLVGIDVALAAERILAGAENDSRRGARQHAASASAQAARGQCRKAQTRALTLRAAAPFGIATNSRRNTSASAPVDRAIINISARKRSADASQPKALQDRGRGQRDPEHDQHADRPCAAEPDRERGGERGCGLETVCHGDLPAPCGSRRSPNPSAARCARPPSRRSIRICQSGRSNDPVGASSVPRGAPIPRRASARVDRTIFPALVLGVRGCGADPAERGVRIALSREIAERHDAHEVAVLHDGDPAQPRSCASARRVVDRCIRSSVLDVGALQIRAASFAVSLIGEAAHHEVAVRHDAEQAPVVAAHEYGRRRRIPSSCAPHPRPSDVRSA